MCCVVYLRLMFPVQWTDWGRALGEWRMMCVMLAVLVRVSQVTPPRPDNALQAAPGAGSKAV